MCNPAAVCEEYLLSPAHGSSATSSCSCVIWPVDESTSLLQMDADHLSAAAAAVHKHAGCIATQLACNC